MAANAAAATAAGQAMKTVTIANPNPTDDSDDEDSPSASPVCLDLNLQPFFGAEMTRSRFPPSWLSDTSPTST